MTRRIALAVLFSGILSAAQNPKAEKEVMAAMNAFKDALIKKDVPSMDKLVHEELQYSHSNGVLTQDKKVWLEYVAKEANTVYVDWGEQRIRVYGNVAVATGVVDIRGGDGQTPFLVKMIHVWSKENGRWQLLSRQATRVTPPGGAGSRGAGRGQPKQ
jgi:ketosteroid isomerase-like protein